MIPPIKPFQNYKWRWATLTCTEGLNEPAVYLGVLRAMRTHEGKRPSDPALMHTLQRVQSETNTSVILAKSDTQRNILRNSGQYWKALDLMADNRTGIELTPFGQSVADGQVTPVEFATTTVNRLTLPNDRIDTKAAEWGDLKIKPLQLILQILAEVNQVKGAEQAYLTPRELINIIIPLAGETAPVAKHVNALILHRDGELDLTDWPDCALGANDARMAREFLLFLSHYGFTKCADSTKRMDEKHYLASLEVEEVLALAEIDTSTESTLGASRIISDSRLPASVERKRVLINTLYRPNQAKFRDDVLAAYAGTCFLTGVQVPAVLEAAHIIPVSSDGPDSVSNSICLRTDIHRLFDSSHLRLSPSGDLRLSDSASQEHNYGYLPNAVEFPDFVDIANVAWRWEYT